MNIIFRKIYIYIYTFKLQFFFHVVSEGLEMQAKKEFLHRILREPNYIGRVIKNLKLFVI